jgi:hypothetical protein
MHAHKTYTKQGKLNGKLVEFNITEEWAYDDMAVDGSFDFGSEEENQKYLDRFVSGELISLLLGVKAEAFGCTGTDFLGGCHINVDSVDADIKECITFNAMVETAIEDCKHAIKEQVETLTPFFVNLPK